jgi:hypothetical protein
MPNTFFRVLARVGGYRHATHSVPEAPEAWMPADLQAVYQRESSALPDRVAEQPSPPRLGRGLRPTADAELPVDVRAVVHHRLRT